jgi:high-affinity Fe2+/Pb2+ permease
MGEDSLVGQLLYALIGYEATPSATEAGAYAAGLLAMAVVIFVGWWSSPVVPGERE